MKNASISPTLKSLVTENSELCVSMIIPLHNIPSFRKIDAIVVDHAIEKLRALMQPAYSNAVVTEFIEKIKYMKDDIKRVSGVNGIGIFMSDQTFHTETFDFDVKEKIHAGTSFEVRDVLYKELRLKEYYVLSLGGHELRLYKGRGTELREVKDHNFPALSYRHDVAETTARRQPHNSFHALTRRMPEVIENPKPFLRALDRKLLEYLEPESTLLLTGLEKEFAAFEPGTIHKDKVKGKIPGSYDAYNHTELENKCGRIMEALRERTEHEMITLMTELFGRELVSVGISDVWRSAFSGRGNVLLVEKDLMMPGFIGKDDHQLWLAPPNEQHRIITDAVDDVIETVLEKNGKVLFVENGRLQDFKGIAMINRY
jgi:hypothetical protein